MVKSPPGRTEESKDHVQNTVRYPGFCHQFIGAGANQRVKKPLLPCGEEGNDHGVEGELDSVGKR